MQADSYLPPLYLRNGHTNSLLASSPLRKRKVLRASHNFLATTDTRTLLLDEGVRLQALFNLQAKHHRSRTNPLIVFLHGWEGCADSLYIIDLAARLHAQGYDTARLNFRDHGRTQHLNEGLFHSCRLNEVRDGIIAIQQQCDGRQVVIIGFSLGGNFALRIAAQPVSLNIKKILSICPVIKPQHTLRQLEQGNPIYRHYFLKRWKQSLQRKAQVFPHRYRFEEIRAMDSLRDLTQHLVLAHTEYQSLEDYLNGYSIAGERLATVTTPVQVLLSQDDPLIPVADHELLASNSQVKIEISRYGGHCGFLGNAMRLDWLYQYVLHSIRSTGGSPPA